MVYDDIQPEEANSQNEDFIENHQDPNFITEYVAKVLNYKENLESSKFVGVISYKDPNSIR